MSRSHSFLYPFLHSLCRPAIPKEYARLFACVKSRASSTVVDTQTQTATATVGDTFSVKVRNHDRNRRVEKLRQHREDVTTLFPRYTNPSSSMPGVVSPGIFMGEDDKSLRHVQPKKFHEIIKDAQKGDFFQSFGRVTGVRTHGSKLAFVTIERQGHSMQATYDFGKLEHLGIKLEDFKSAMKIIRIGDWYRITCAPYKKDSKIELVATRLPECLAPSLRQIPEDLQDLETLARYPHVKALIKPSQNEILRLRNTILSGIRRHLGKMGFMEVETPILEGRAGGATARPFETHVQAQRISESTLTLRIAPELSLKRLIVAGNEAIFEIGKVFRNEGIDSTHNPEFTICEFYEVGADLRHIMSRTFQLLGEVQAEIKKADKHFKAITIKNLNFKNQFPIIDFVPALEKATRKPLPHVGSPDSLAELVRYTSDLGISVPSETSVPLLLDLLADKYLVPQCQNPTWIAHPPECVSPLAKSSYHKPANRVVARSAELYIEGKEIVNCYEEENSPFVQRRKFKDQVKFRAGQATSSEDVEIDESYLEVLDWGMPPTGGWGCGIDRLVMLFSGQDRIADVLPFGSLRNSVAMSRNGHAPVKGSKGSPSKTEEDN